LGRGLNEESQVEIRRKKKKGMGLNRRWGEAEEGAERGNG